MTIENNVALGKLAASTMQEIEALMELAEPPHEHYYSVLLELIQAKLPAKAAATVAKRNVAFTYSEAWNWERQAAMPYGEYVGLHPLEVPTERLGFYDRNAFADELHRYCLSTRFTERQNNEHGS